MRPRPIGAALDVVAFGPAKTLDLHAFRTVEEATRHAERWLRERQVAGAGSVLIITGRGAHSVDGVAVLRPAIQRLFTRLRRLGVVTAARQHTEGSFTVVLAPVTALFEAPPRARAREPLTAVDERAFSGLSSATRDALRGLAERTLEALGMRQLTAHLVEDEMRRQLSLLTPGLPTGEDRDIALRRTALEAIASMEDE
jgi:hypothetical protein